MKATPKLQDTLEIFFDKFEEMEATLIKTQNIIPELNKTITHIEQSKVKVDLEDFQLLTNNFKKVVQENETKFLSMTEDHAKKIAKASSKAQFLHYYFYVAIFMAFAITIISVIIAMTYKGTNELLLLQNQANQVDIQEFNAFMVDNDLLETYKDWKNVQEEN